MKRSDRSGNTASGRPPAVSARGANLAFLPLLAAAYALAAVAPVPPAMTLLPGGVTASQLILAGLLFVAGRRMSLPMHRTGIATVAGLAAVGVFARLAGLAATVAVTRTLRESGCSTTVSDTLIGLSLVAAMPSANTSTAWTRRGGGDLALCVVIVVLTTLASPAVVPSALRIAGVSHAADAVKFPEIAFGVIAWVVVPMALGMAVGRLSPRSVGLLPEPAAAFFSLGALILLNYLNASRALPDLLVRGTGEPLVLAAAAGLALVTVLNGCGAMAGLFAGASEASRTAVLHAVGMSNTALAATLAAEFFPDRPQILYPAITCTLFQHAVAAWMTISRPPSGPGDST